MSDLTNALIAAKLMGNGGGGGGGGLPSSGLFEVEVKETASGGFPPVTTRTILTPYADIQATAVAMKPMMLKFFANLGDKIIYTILSPNKHGETIEYWGSTSEASEGSIHVWSYGIIIDLSEQTATFSLDDAVIFPPE